MATSSELAAGTGLAGGAVAVTLLEALYDKGILDLTESREVLDRALKVLAPVIQTPEGYTASGIITASLRGKFSARG
jgi:hypothetical protein